MGKWKSKVGFFPMRGEETQLKRRQREMARRSQTRRRILAFSFPWFYLVRLLQ